MATPDDIRRSAFEQSALPLVAVDGRGILALWNASFERFFRSLTGAGPEGFRLSLFDLIREREGLRFDYYAAELLLGARSSEIVETPMVDVQGRRRWLRVSMSQLEPGEPVSLSTGPLPGERFILCSMEEITDRVVREGRLREAKEEAEKATHTKSLFLANMSHEIRTPIQTILGVVELLHETSLDGEQSEYATQIRFSAEVLLALINDILDFSKIEAGKLDLEATDFDLPSTVYQSVDLLVMDAHRKGLEVLVDLGESVPATIRGDPTRLRQIIVNLFKNAIKFTSEGSVSLSMRIVGDSGRPCLRFEIRDTGIGIPEEVRERLFTPFYQADFGAARKTGGTGLGLAISRHLVGLMGGSIGATANAPRGSVFWFEVPLAIPEYAALRQFHAEANPGLRLLIVDDSAEARTIASRIAAKAGYIASDAASGEEALSMLREAALRGEPFALCLIDQNMPHMYGWRLASEITADTTINGARLVLMVPEGTMGGEAKMKLLRWFDAYVSKPLRPERLLETLASASATDVDLDTAEPRQDGQTAVALDPTFEAEVFIAEDHEVNRELFALILSKLGCSVTTARDGMEAVEIGSERVAQGRPFDIILMDIFMPRMNGYEASGILREKGYRGPLVAVTASALKGEREKCIEAGMDDILVKPFKKRDLALLLEAWLPASKGGKRPDDAEGGEKTRPGREAYPRVVQAREAGSPETGAAAPSNPSAAERKEIFDWEGVLETFLGQKETVVSLLHRFVAKARTQLVDLEAALEAKDFAAFREVAHSLKGASLNLSASRLGNAAKDAEMAGKNGDGEAASLALAATRKAYEDFALVVVQAAGPPPD